ncbi:MAG: UDP-glucose/GDP-mannose dehydrogenase family protein, partial [Pseudomonadota bacterium]
MRIAVIGTGYVGLVTGACFAETGNDVTCVDIDRAKVEKLSRGEVPFYEPGLPELVTRNLAEGRLRFSSSTADATQDAQICFICVGTPSKPDGSADLGAVFAAAETAASAAANVIMTVKSTVPIGTCHQVLDHLRSKGKEGVRVVSNPEFLREGNAVQDCLFPDRIVVGTEDPVVAQMLCELYGPYVRTGHPILVMDVRSAEMTKYAANSLLAQRISFMNEISMVCDAVGADVSLVRKGIAADHRIGEHYLFPSVGFGGSCFPKDVRALASLAESKGIQPRLLQATLAVNEAQKKNFVDKIFRHFGGPGAMKGKTLAVWGLAFKAKTDDIRESPALAVIDGLLSAGAKLSVY